MTVLSMSVQDVKEATGLGLTKVYSLLKSGEIPAKKIGKRTFVLKSDLEDFLNNLDSYPVKKQGE